MIFTNEILVRLAIIVLGLCGFLVSKHIRDHKTKNTPLVCMRGFDCHAVVHSDYSKFLGMPVELMGMIYYAFISIVNLSLVFSPDIFSFGLTSFGFGIFFIALSLAAFIFSLYLISVQIFVIKKGCSWCIISSIISALIFLLIMVK